MKRTKKTNKRARTARKSGKVARRVVRKATKRVVRKVRAAAAAAAGTEGVSYQINPKTGLVEPYDKGETNALRDFLNEEKLNGKVALRETWKGFEKAFKGAKAYLRDLETRIARLKEVVVWA